MLLALPNVDESSAVVWALTAAAFFYAVVSGVAKVIGPLLDSVETVIERRRTMRQSDEDARIVDLTNQLEHVVGRVDQLEAYARDQTTYLALHAHWDRSVTTACVAAGIVVDPPPPLAPPLPQTRPQMPTQPRGDTT